VTLHNEYGKVVHRLYNSCISSIQKLNKNFIKFFLLTQTRSGSKTSQSKFLQIGSRGIRKKLK